MLYIGEENIIFLIAPWWLKTPMKLFESFYKIINEGNHNVFVKYLGSFVGYSEVR